MTYFRVIVAGTTGSQASLSAVRKAAEIAARSRARLIVATARPSVNSPAMPLYSGNPIDPPEVTESAEVVLGRTALIAKSAGADDVELLVLDGDPVDALINLAREVVADLIVVGEPRRSRLGCLRLSTGDVLRRRARTQVLIVKSR